MRSLLLIAPVLISIKAGRAIEWRCMALPLAFIRVEGQTFFKSSLLNSQS